MRYMVVLVISDRSAKSLEAFPSFFSSSIVRISRYMTQSLLNTNPRVSFLRYLSITSWRRGVHAVRSNFDTLQPTCFFPSLSTGPEHLCEKSPDHCTRYRFLHDLKTRHQPISSSAVYKAVMVALYSPTLPFPHLYWSLFDCLDYH